MNDIERQLAELGPERPPKSLDRSIEGMIAWAEIERRTRAPLWRPLAAAAIGCVVGILIGGAAGMFLGGAPAHPSRDAATVIVVEPTPELMRWFAGSDRAGRPGFFEREHAEIETIYLHRDDAAPTPPGTL